MRKRMRDFIEKNKELYFVILICVLSVSVPLYRTGIMMNDELRARFKAFQGVGYFYKSEFIEWIGQGRLLGAPINSFTKYLAFIGADSGTNFRIIQILIVLCSILLFGLLVYKLFDDKYLSAWIVLLCWVCLPTAVEHTLPTTFVGLLGIPFCMLLSSLILFVQAFQDMTKNIGKLIVSMILYFCACLAYEAFVTFVVLYYMIVWGKTGGITKIKVNFSKYFIPTCVALIYIGCYVVSGFFFTSGYEGNQMGFDSIWGPIKILFVLFVASIPGFYVLNPKYQYFKTIYDNLELMDYFRVFLVIISFVFIAFFLYKQSRTENIQEEKKQYKKDIYILFCGIMYMIIPGIPNSISRMYQGNVGINNGFTALPVTYFEYFAAVFVLGYLMWMISRTKCKKIYVILIILLGIWIGCIQQMNDIISKQHYSNFQRLVQIEKFLDTKTFKTLEGGTYIAEDLYKCNNLLAIHDEYWSEYCTQKLGLSIALPKSSTSENGSIYYDDDNMVIVEKSGITVFSDDHETEPKAVQVSGDSYILFEFVDEFKDNDIYVYYMQNDGSLYHVKGYVPQMGYYPDGWLERTSLFDITTGDKGQISLSLYYPGERFENRKLRVYINDEIVKEHVITQNYSDFVFHTNTNESILMRIECEFGYDEKMNDERDIAIYLAGLVVE